MKINRFVFKGYTNGLQHRFMRNTGYRVGSYRRGQAIDNQVYLAQVFFNYCKGLLFYFIGESIAIDTFCIEAGLLCLFFKSRCIVPAGRSCFTFRRRFFKIHTNSGSTTGKGAGNS